MQFKKDAPTVPVNFISTTFSLKASDKDETVYEVTLDMGWIDPKYQNSTYFDYYKENMFGLSPLRTDGLDNSTSDLIMARQFLY